MRNLHLRAQTFSQACHASGTGQINGAWPSLTINQMQTCISRCSNPMVHCTQDGTLPCRWMIVSSIDEAAW